MAVAMETVALSKPCLRRSLNSPRHLYSKVLPPASARSELVPQQQPSAGQSADRMPVGGAVQGRPRKRLLSGSDGRGSPKGEGLDSCRFGERPVSVRKAGGFSPPQAVSRECVTPLPPPTPPTHISLPTN